MLFLFRFISNRSIVIFITQTILHKCKEICLHQYPHPLIEQIRPSFDSDVFGKRNWPNRYGKVDVFMSFDYSNVKFVESTKSRICITLIFLYKLNHVQYMY